MKKNAIILAFILLMISQLGFSQWSFHSSFPETSSIIDLSIGQAGNVYLLTSDRQIYRSTDNGNTWTSFVETPLFLNVLEIEASKVSNRVFIKTNCCGVAYTDNFGTTWSWDNLFTQTGGFGLSPLGIDVFQTKTAAVTSRFVSGIGIVHELYTSTTNGTSSTWNLSHTFAAASYGPRDVFVLDNNLVFSSFALLSTAPLGTPTLKRSTDGGSSFTDISFFDDTDLIDLLITPSQTIYCATNTTTSGEIHQSDNLGDTWTTITPPTATTKIVKLAYDDVNDLLYAVTEDGIYRKMTGGSWEGISTQNNLVAIEINANQAILTGGLTVLGVQKSPTAFVFFNTIEIGGDFSPAWVRVTGDAILIGNRNNPIISKSDIATPNIWQHTVIQNVPLSAEAVGFGATVGSFGAQVKNNEEVTVSGNNYIANVATDLSFNIIADEVSGAPLAPISNPAFIPQNLKLSNNDGLLIKQLQANYIDFSADDGTTWSVLNPVAGEPTKITLNFCAGTTNFYVSTNDFSMTFGDEVHYSSDGTTWNSIPLPNNTNEQGIFIDNQDDLYLLASNPLTLYRLDMVNQQWITTSLDLHNDPNTYFELAFDSDNNMYALNFRTTSTSSTSQGIAYSDDQGVSWTNEPFPTEGGNTIYLESMGFDGAGIMFAKTSNDENNAPSITKGVYSFESTLVSVSELNIASVSIYPNPVTDYFNVRVTEKGSYKIYDLLGKEISSGIILAGDNNVQFPQSQASGIYVITIRTANVNFSEKMVFRTD